MAKLIKVEQSKLEEVVRNFAAWLSKTKLTTGRISYQQDVTKVDRKATVTFKSVAWLKMKYLIALFDGECGWHFVCHRSDDAEDEYIIEDVLVYPQQVSSATVNTDQEEYAKWEDALPDEVFNNLRGHGHSHVNMGITPSPTDLDHQDKRLEALSEDSFYIFTIWNKKGDRNWRIFDFQKNIMFETADVEVLIDGDDGIFEFMEDAKNLVTTKKYTTTSYKAPSAATNTKTPAAGVVTSTQKPAAGAASGEWWHSAYDYDRYDEYWR